MTRDDGFVFADLAPWPHLAAAGALAVADRSGLTARMVHTPADVTVSIDIAPHAMAQMILDHANYVNASPMWISRCGTTSLSPCGPVWPTGDPADQHQWRAVRAAGTTTDHRLMAGLGVGQAEGFSRSHRTPWDMWPATRGATVIPSRLLPLSAHLSDRNVRSVAAGLTGAETHDLPGAKAGLTLGGLASRGPVDSAVAWCVLWGLTVLPTRRVSSHAYTGPVATVGYAGGRLHFPIFTQPADLLEVASVCRSDAFARAIGAAPAGASGLNHIAGRVALAQRGIGGILSWSIVRERKGPTEARHAADRHLAEWSDPVQAQRAELLRS